LHYRGQMGCILLWPRRYFGVDHMNYLAKSVFAASALIMIMIAANAGVAQTQTGASAQRIVIVDTAAFFNEKTGIVKIINVSRQVANELAPRRAEVNAIATRVETLDKELETLKQNTASGIPVDQKAAQAKYDEVERLKREGKFKQDDFNAYAEKRQQQVVGPVFADVMKALAEYVKLKGFGMVFDVSKDQSGMLIYATEQFEITKDFISYYNSRPVTTIAPVPPK
jgi:Skp family chaperone for outer membrane proteins